MRIATWNVNTFNPRRAADKLRLLELIDWDVALLQEVGVSTFETFTSGSLRGVHAVAALGGAWDERAHGVAILVRDSLSIEDSGLVPIEPDASGEADQWRRARILSARVRMGETVLTVASFHAPDAAGVGEERVRKIGVKMRLFRALDAWVRTASSPLVVGMDGNVWTDSIDPMPLDPKDAFYDQHRFHNAGADHGLRDVLHEHLRMNRPELLERRRRLGLRPDDGALAVTYQRATNNHPRVNRMDRIYVSWDFRVRGVETLYDEALTVGSDHAMVVADLEVQLGGDQPDDDLMDRAQEGPRVRYGLDGRRIE